MSTKPQTHKRDVILEFHSSPDAILNALHQAGGQVISRSQCKERGKPEPASSKTQVALFATSASGERLSKAVDAMRYMLYGLALDARQAVIAQQAIDEAVDAVREW